MQVYNTELKHFGILGMKQGHHKATYGISSGQLKRNINRADKKEVRKVQAEYKNELNSAVSGKNFTREQTSAAARVIGKKYVAKFNNALLKDINYADVEKGKKMLIENKLNFKIDKTYGVVRKDFLGTHVYG